MCVSKKVLAAIQRFVRRRLRLKKNVRVFVCVIVRMRAHAHAPCVFRFNALRACWCVGLYR